VVNAKSVLIEYFMWSAMSSVRYRRERRIWLQFEIGPFDE
jgi:hypothetical protein